MDKAERLLQAHLDFELNRWTGKTCAADLQALLDQLWSWAENTSLQQLLDADTAVDTTLRWIDDWYLPDTVTLLIGTLTKRLIHLPINEATRVGDVVDEQLFEAAVDLVVELERLRESLIQRATESPIYAMLISNVLYSGIRDYLTGENAVTSKVPGMSSLLSKGASALNKRMPGLETAIEDRLRKYISNNAQKSIRLSQKFLLESLTEEQIRRLADQIWDQGQHTQLTISAMVSDDEIDRLVSFGLAIWQDLRQSSYIHELIREGIYGFYDGYGSESLQVLLEHMGLNRAGIGSEMQTLLPGLLQNAHATGLLKTWLEPRLKAFYDSAACRSLLDA